MSTPNKNLDAFTQAKSILQTAGLRIWLGQSVDTSVLHTKIDAYKDLPVLTSVGCAFRRPKSLIGKFGGNLRGHVGAAGPLMLDSGGFVLMMKDVPSWTVERTLELYRKVDADHLVTLDVPPGPNDDDEVRSKKFLSTASNFEFLYDHLGSRIMPVLHGSNLDQLYTNAQLIRNISPKVPTLGLGGLVPWLQRSGNVRRDSDGTPQRRIFNAIKVAKDVFPESKIHIFGVGSIHTILGVVALGANSIDSIGWRQTAGFGSVYVPGRHRRLITNRDRKKNCRPIVSEEEKEILRVCQCSACGQAETTNIDLLSKSFVARSLHNIHVLHLEISQYCSATQRNSANKFLSERLSDAWLQPIASS